nr:ISL3 family transposase [Sphingomonas naasensis]
MRHVFSNGQHTFESKTVAPRGDPCCAHWAKRWPNGFRSQQFIDEPRGTFPAIIHHKRRRWGCDHCGGTTYEELPWAFAGRGMTWRLSDWILKEGAGTSFTRVADRCGLDARTVADVFQERAIPVVKEIKAHMPRVLGLDEKHIFQGFRAVMGNVEQRTMFWMLPSRSNEALSEFFAKRDDLDRVEVVTVDMYAGYRKLLKDWFPRATVVIDKFHITRYATMAMDRARAALRPGQTQRERVKMLHQRWCLLKHRQDWEPKHVAAFHRMTEMHPELAEIYEWKERACAIWDLSDRREAEQAYIAWRRDLPTKYARFFKRFTSAMTNWGDWIFNYFEHRYTNAYVERLNGMIDDANRIGRGYSYRVLFLKTMLQHGVPKPRKKKVNRSRDILDGVVYDFMTADVDIFGAFGDIFEEEPVNHGIPLATLSEAFRDRSRW